MNISIGYLCTYVKVVNVSGEKESVHLSWQADRYNKSLADLAR